MLYIDGRRKRSPAAPGKEEMVMTKTEYLKFTKGMRVPEILAALIPEILASPIREVGNDGVATKRGGTTTGGA